MKSTLFIASFTTTLFAAELLTNGAFETPLANGWLQELAGDQINPGFYTFDRGNYDADSDTEGYARKYLHGSAFLCQMVPAPNLDIRFSVDARLFPQCQKNNFDYYSASAIALQYLDNNDIVLGTTRIYRGTMYCNWQNTPTLHLILAPDTVNWHRYSFDIRTELANLSGVNPAQVKRIKAGLYAHSTYGC
jgi:hypothetical protein